MDKIRKFYFKYENKYYAFLDRLEPKYHLYKIVEPIDKIVPSFALLLGLAGVVILLLLLFVFSLFAGPGGTLITLQVVDKASGDPISGADVTITHGSETYLGISDSDGYLMATVTSDEITVEVAKQGYSAYTRNFLIEEGYVIEAKISKESAARPTDTSVKTINVVDSESGKPIMDSVRLNFSCSGAGRLPDMTVTSGSVPIKVPENCGVLQVSARAPGYPAETAIVKASTTYIRLSKDAPSLGRLVVRVLDNSSQPVSGITLQVYSAANIPQGSSQSDSAGSATFELNPGNYYATAYNPSGKYADGKSSPVSVRAGQTENVAVTMQPQASPGKVLKIKFTDFETGEAIAGVDAAIYKDGVEFTRAPSESDGTVTIPNASEGSTYTITARHDSYLMKTTGVISLVAENENAVVIQLEKPNELNSASATVYVKKAMGEPIEQAQVYLYVGDENEVSGSYVAQGRTNEAGNIEFVNLPPASYYAYAEYETYKGTSEPQDLAAGVVGEFEITMVVSKGTLLITAEDEQRGKVQFAKVAVFDSFTNEKVAEGVTDTKGKFQAELFWNIEPYFEIEAEGFFDYRSSNHSLIPNEKTEVDVVLFLEDSYPDLALNFEGVYSSTMKSVVDTFSEARTYMYKFKIIVPENYEDVEAVFVANPQDSDLENSYFVLKSPFLAGAEYDFSTLAVYNPLEPYLVLDEEIAEGTSARRMVVSLGDLSPGVYDFFVAARLEESGQTYIPFRMDYGMRAYLDADEYLFPPIALYTQTHRIGVPQNCEGVAGSDFPLEIDFEDALTGERTEAGSSALELRQHLSGYAFSITLSNCSSAKIDYSGYKMEFVSDSESAEIEGKLFSEANPVSRSASFNYGDSISESFGIEGLREDSEVPLTVNLKSPDGKLLATKELHFEVIPMGEMEITASPQEVFDIVGDTIEVALKGESGESITNADVYLYAEDPNFAVETPKPLSSATRADRDGIYSLTWAPRNSGLRAGDYLYLAAESPSYSDASAQIEILSYARLAPIDLDCVTVDTESMLIESVGAASTFTVTTKACPLPLDIKVVKDGGALDQTLLVRKSGGESGGTQRELLLRDVPATGSVSVDVLASDSTIQGAYGLTVDAELVGSGRLQRVAVIDVLVLGTGDFELVDSDGAMKTVFDLQMAEEGIPGSDTATVKYSSSSTAPEKNDIIDCIRTAFFRNSSGLVDLQLDPETGVCEESSAGKTTISFELVAQTSPGNGDNSNPNPETSAYAITFKLDAENENTYGQWEEAITYSDNYPDVYVADVGLVGNNDRDYVCITQDCAIRNAPNQTPEGLMGCADPSDCNVSDAKSIVYKVPAAGTLTISKKTEISQGFVIAVAKSQRIPDNDKAGICVVSENPRGSCQDNYTPFDYTKGDFLFAQNYWNGQRALMGTGTDAYSSWDIYYKFLDCFTNRIAKNKFESKGNENYFTDRDTCETGCETAYSLDGLTNSELQAQLNLQNSCKALCEDMVSEDDGRFENIDWCKNERRNGYGDFAYVFAKEGYFQAMNWHNGNLGLPFSNENGWNKDYSVEVEEGDYIHMATGKGGGKVTVVYQSGKLPANDEGTEDEETTPLVFEAVSAELCGSESKTTKTVSIKLPADFAPASDTVTASDLEDYYTVSCITPDGSACDDFSLEIAPDSTEEGNPNTEGEETMPETGLANFTLTLSVSECPTGIGPSETWDNDKFNLNVANKTLQGYKYDVLTVKDYVEEDEVLSPKEGKFRVRLDAGTSLLGEDYLPDIYLGWNWDDFDLGGSNYGMCDFKYGDYVYCDSTQIMLEVVQKMMELKNRNANDSLTGTDASELTNFNAYLLYDDYSSGFLQQFIRYSESQFVSAPTDYTSFFKGYLAGKFSMLRKKGSCTDKRSPGVYKINIDVEGEDYTFEEGKTKVTATCLSDITSELKKNPFYYMPFNGNVGIGSGGTRSGFGLGYTGTASSDIYILRASGATEGDPEWVKLQDVGGGVMPLSYSSVEMPEQKGRLMKLTKGTSGIELEYSPIVATTLILGMKQKEKEARIFYKIKDSSLNNADMGESALTLLPYQSSIGELEYFDGSNMEPMPDQKLSTYSPNPSGCTAPAYGIYKSDLPEEKDESYVHYKAVLYTPLDYSIENACAGDTTSSLSTSGATEPTGWETPVQVSSETTGSIEAVLKLVRNKKAGILIDEENATWSILWNESELMKGFS